MNTRLLLKVSVICNDALNIQVS